MAQSAEYPDLRWMPPRAYGRGRDGKAVRYIVIHYTAGAERNTSAEDGAVYDQNRTDGTSTHYFCMDPATRVLTAAMTWVAIGDLHEGDQLVGVDEYAETKSKRRFRLATVTRTLRRVAPRYRITTTDGRELVSSRDHRWLVHRSNNWQWRTADTIRPGSMLLAPLRTWDEPTDLRGMAWLGGIFDGEGCYGRSTGMLSFAQREGAVLDYGRAVLDAAGIPYSLHKRPNDVTILSLSGVQALMQVLGQARPVRFLDRPELWVGKAVTSSRLHSARVEVATVEEMPDGVVVSISTDTGTFIAEGVVSHNCDSDSVVQCVLTTDRGNAARTKGNRLGIQYELCGTVQTRAQWLDAASRATLQNAARQVARDCRKYDIPARRLTVAETRRAWTDFPAGPRGIVGHVDCTNAYPEDGGDHTDPGAQFPWDVFLDMVRAELEGDDVTAADVWNADGLIKNPSWRADAPTNPYIAGKTALAILMSEAHAANVRAGQAVTAQAQLAAQNAAILKTVTGGQVTADVIRAELAKFQGQITAAIVAQAVPLLAEQLGDKLDDITQDQLAQAVETVQRKLAAELAAGGTGA